VVSGQSKKSPAIDALRAKPDDEGMMHTSGYLYRLWEEGQRHLAAGRYVAARSLLERASDMAWRGGDARSLARIYLPLLEARRLIRYRAAEGNIVIGGVAKVQSRRQLREFEQEAEGTFLVCAEAPRARRLANDIGAAARRSGHCLEALLLLGHSDETRLVSPGEPTFTAGLPVTWTRDAAAAIGASTDAALVVPLPRAGVYDGKGPGLGGVARESVLIAWEALALRWQSRHPLPKGGGAWEELLWLREALRIDPACEPISMRLIAVAEGVERRRR
jgi:hypothetical protein